MAERRSEGVQLLFLWVCFCCCYSCLVGWFLWVFLFVFGDASEQRMPESKCQERRAHGFPRRPPQAGALAVGGGSPEGDQQGAGAASWGHRTTSHTLEVLPHRNELSRHSGGRKSKMELLTSLLLRLRQNLVGPPLSELRGLAANLWCRLACRPVA